jgi:pyruvate-formate lyase
MLPCRPLSLSRHVAHCMIATSDCVVMVMATSWAGIAQLAMMLGEIVTSSVKRRGVVAA